MPAGSGIQPMRVYASDGALQHKDLGWLDSGSRLE